MNLLPPINSTPPLQLGSLREYVTGRKFPGHFQETKSSRKKTDMQIHQSLFHVNCVLWKILSKMIQKKHITHIYSIRVLLTHGYFCRDVSLLTDVSLTNVPTNTLNLLVIKFSIIIKYCENFLCLVHDKKRTLFSNVKSNLDRQKTFKVIRFIVINSFLLKIHESYECG